MLYNKAVELSTICVNSKKQKGLLKWAGGKAQLVPILKQFWEPYKDRLFVAPFCGGLGDVLGLNPKYARLNDACIPLINFYWHVQIGLVVRDRDRGKEAYYNYRKQFNEIITKPNWWKNTIEAREAAELFYWLNRTCFNGLMRSNRKGEMNTPWGTERLFDLDLRSWKQKLGISPDNVSRINWTFSASHYKLIHVSDRAFCYSDPPYDPMSETASFTSYGVGRPFTWEDQVEHAYWLLGIASEGVPVVTSNHATPRIIKLYSGLGFTLEVVEALRKIGAKASTRKKVPEILAWKNIDHEISF